EDPLGRTAIPTFFQDVNAIVSGEGKPLPSWSSGNFLLAHFVNRHTGPDGQGVIGATGSHGLPIGFDTLSAFITKYIDCPHDLADLCQPVFSSRSEHGLRPPFPV